MYNGGGWRKIKYKYNKMVKKTKNQNKTKQRKKNRGINKPASFGPVSQINTAPVSVGNSVRGSRPRISQTTNGARVVGRDFAFALSGTVAAITGWELIGGMPITPCCLPSSVLRNYCQMFQKFKVNSIVVHYITSSPTSQAGDVLFYYERDALAPMCDYSNSSFLPFVLSDPHTMIGPQWTNHSALIKPTSEWKTTLYGNQIDLNEDKAGTLFFFSKTNAANSPGYLLIDYDISFKELAVNVRAGTLPIARAQSSFVCLDPGSSTTTGNAASFSVSSSFKNIANVTSVSPTGYVLGDIYKVILQVTASTQANAAWSGTGAPTTATYLRYSDDLAITIDDGFTCYGLASGSNTITLYATMEGAATGTKFLEWGFTGSSLVAPLCVEMQLVRNVDALTQSSY